jgi:hypothetical protein
VILALTLAGILTTQPVDRVFFDGRWSVLYTVGNKEWFCPNAKVSLTGAQATVAAQVCTVGLFKGNFE